MRGLRTRENSRFKKFFSLVQESAKKEGKIFFLDTAEGHDFATDEMDLEDLSGWLVPIDQADRFEREWERERVADGFEDVSDRWDSNYCFALWDMKGNTVSIRFKFY